MSEAQTQTKHHEKYVIDCLRANCLKQESQSMRYERVYVCASVPLSADQVSGIAAVMTDVIANTPRLRIHARNAGAAPADGRLPDLLGLCLV